MRYVAIRTTFYRLLNFPRQRGFIPHRGIRQRVPVFFTFFGEMFISWLKRS